MTAGPAHHRTGVDGTTMLSRSAQAPGPDNTEPGPGGPGPG